MDPGTVEVLAAAARRSSAVAARCAVGMQRQNTAHGTQWRAKRRARCGSAPVRSVARQ